MKSKPLRLLILCAALFGIAAGLHAWSVPKLPRVTLKNGRELRVLKVSYGVGKDHEHNLGGAADWQRRAWKALPAPLRKMFPSPRLGVDGGNELEFCGFPVISVWVATPPQEKTDLQPPLLGSTSPLRVSVSNGSALIWHRSIDAGAGNVENSQIVVIIVPDATRELDFSVSVSDEQVAFKIPNPAYRNP